MSTLSKTFVSLSLLVVSLLFIVGTSDAYVYAPCTFTYTSSRQTAFILSNGLFSTTITKATGQHTSWKIPLYSPIDLLGNGGQFQWNLDNLNGGGTGVNFTPNNMVLTFQENTVDRIHIVFSQPNGVASTSSGPGLDMVWEIHYVIEADLAGIYTWMNLKHFDRQPNGSPTTCDSLGEIRAISRLNHGDAAHNYLNRVFDYARISDSLNTTRLQPTYGEALAGPPNTPQMPVEVEFVNLTDGTTAFIHKYDMSMSSLWTQAHGFYNSSYHYGQWFIYPDYSWKNGGPFNIDLTCSYGPTVGTSTLFASLTYFSGAHSGAGMEPVCGNWSRTYGPQLIYFNNATDNDALWDDVMNRYQIEKNAFPYTFVNDSSFQESNRASVQGTFSVYDTNDFSTVWGSFSLNGSLIVLVEPEHSSGRMYQQSLQYWYFGYTLNDGSFSIEHVLPGLYELHAWRNGTWGEYIHPILINVVSTGVHQIITVGDIIYQPIHYGIPLWSIGRFDMSTEEFSLGNAFRYYQARAQFATIFPNGVNYEIDMTQTKDQQIAQWRSSWPFELTPGVTGNTTANFNIFFNTTFVVTNQMLSFRTMVWYGVSTGVLIYVNNVLIADWSYLQTYSTASVYRDGSRGTPYDFIEANFSSSILVPPGMTNIMTISTFTAPGAAAFNSGQYFDAFVLELMPPTNPILSSSAAPVPSSSGVSSSAVSSSGVSSSGVSSSGVSSSGVSSSGVSSSGVSSSGVSSSGVSSSGVSSSGVSSSGVSSSGATSSPVPEMPINTCCFQFTSPQLPSFTLPAAQPNSPGDTVLNSGNPIGLSNGNPLSQGCNGNSLEYYDPITQSWLSSYTDANGNYHTSIGIVYASGTSDIVRTIQTSDSPLETLLANRLVRLDLTCNNNINSCVEFAFGTPQLYGFNNSLSYATVC